MLPVLADSSLSAYIAYVNQIPSLSAEEERAYFEAYWLRDDLYAVQSLILAHLKYVVKVAYDFEGYSVPKADLIQEGVVGLMKAIKHFSPEADNRLVAYAVSWIRAEMQQFVLNNWKLFKIGTTAEMKKLFFNYRQLRSKLSQELKDTEQLLAVSQQLGVSQSAVVQADTYFTSSVVEIEEAANIAGGAEPMAHVVALENKRIWDNLLKDAISLMSEREKKILSDRLLSEDPVSLADLAHQEGVSVEAIRKSEKRVLEKLKSVTPAEVKLSLIQA